VEQPVFFLEDLFSGHDLIRSLLWLSHLIKRTFSQRLCFLVPVYIRDKKTSPLYWREQ
jgi:hypothetical protein